MVASALAPLRKKIKSVSTEITEIGSLKPIWEERENSGGVTSRILTGVELDGRSLKSTSRFINSVCSRFSIGPGIFRYYAPDEVFSRIQSVHPRTAVRLTIDGDKALAISNPDKAIVSPESLLHVLSDRGDEVQGISLREGVIISTHTMQDAPWDVAGDVFHQQYTLETSLDSFGRPNIFLSLLREICVNGLIGYAPAFRSEVQLGNASDDPGITLGRVLESYNNEEGFAALRSRLEGALQSYASVAEIASLRRTVTRAFDYEASKALSGILDGLTALAGDIGNIYGLASVDSISVKKQRLLPMKCSIYDTLNFTTELTTHHARLISNPVPIHAWIGTLLSGEYDLEGSIDEPVGESRAFFLKGKASSPKNTSRLN